MENNRTRPYEDFVSVIDENLRKRKNKWALTSVASMDFDDVCQIIRIHIYKKWDQYDQTKPFEPWLNRVISHQIKNLIRNNYSNFTKPCLKCSASLPDDGCSLYETQCSSCPLFKNWQKRKQSAYNVKLPVSMEYHMHEVSEQPAEQIDLEESTKRLHGVLLNTLKPSEKIVYEGLYINGDSEEEVAKRLGYVTSEPGRSPGYKQMRNIKRAIFEKARKCLANDEVDVV